MLNLVIILKFYLNFIILDIKFKLKLLEFQNITFGIFNTFAFNWFRWENVLDDAEKQCVSFRIKSAFYKITFWKIKIIVEYLFKKVNKLELRGAHVSFLHTLTNVLCHIYDGHHSKMLITSVTKYATIKMKVLENI